MDREVPLVLVEKVQGGSSMVLEELPLPCHSTRATPSNCGKSLIAPDTKLAPKGGKVRSGDPLTRGAACQRPG